MKKWLIPVGIIAVIAIGLYSWATGFNNNAVKMNEDVSESWGNVQTSYQRRNDLIGNLVNTVKGAADFEKGTFEAIAKARSSASSINIDPTKVTPEQLAEYNKVQGGLTGALKSLIAVSEAYPTLKANENFLKLQDELASTENQILTARTRFNEAIKPYNNHVKTFPNSILAGWFGFAGKPYFDAEPGAAKPVEVKL